MGMNRIHPECHDATDARLRQEPDEEEEEEDGGEGDEDDDDEDDDGYSE